MIKIRRGADRGQTKLAWLDSRHSFSFAGYRDREHMGFGSLRVINEDRVAPGSGFDPHGHRDMEIITYVLSGKLAHRDSLGNGSVIGPGEVQRMSAGTGIVHSEYNQSGEAPVHLLQIWIEPRSAGLKPSYEQQAIDDDRLVGQFAILASSDGRDGSVRIHQDTDLYGSRLAPGDSVTHSFRQRRKGWLQVARGALALDGLTLEAGDGVAIAEEQAVTITSAEDGAEVLLFDMA